MIKEKKCGMSIKGVKIIIKVVHTLINTLNRTDTNVEVNQRDLSIKRDI